MPAHRVITHDDPMWKQIEADFRRFGFLCASIEQFRVHFRTTMRGWFELADDLNELAQSSYCAGLETLQGRKVADPVALGLQMMPRCLGGFQAAVMLCERGMGIEAQSLIRGVFETAFWMGYVKNDPANAVPQLERETLRSQIGLFEAATRHLSGTPAELRQETLQGLSDMKQRSRTLPSPPGVEELAKRAGYSSSYFFYKELSGAATHMSLKAIDSFIRRDGEGRPTGHQIGPDEEAVGQAIWFGCHSIILAIDALQQLIGTPNQELANLKAKLEALEADLSAD